MVTNASAWHNDRVLVDGFELPNLRTELPGAQSQAFVDRLVKTECPAITFRRNRRSDATATNQDPIVWAQAYNANVVDVDGNTFVDLTSGFGVATIGHRHPAVVDAIRTQSEKMLHAMGDVYPSDVKIAFSERLAEVTPGALQHSILGLNGSDAVASAIKTATIASGRSGIVTLTDSYHGLYYGALSVSDYRKEFRAPFVEQLNPMVSRLRFPTEETADEILADLSEFMASQQYGALIVEPVQGRGGLRWLPDGFLKAAKRICNHFGALLIVDEIWTGFGRVDRWFSTDVEPDVLCVGKGVAGGIPLSAAIGTEAVMASWGHSSGESIHTATFLGNPIACAAGLAAIDVIASDQFVSDSARVAAGLEAGLSTLGLRNVRGRGLAWGFDTGSADASLRLMRYLLESGFLVLPAGRSAETILIAPPAVISDAQIAVFLQALEIGVEQL